jgi:cystathionine beta-lyase/cystathionine gamma-synthase
MNTQHGLSTRAIHAGQTPDVLRTMEGAVSVPIYATSTYVQPEIGQYGKYEYSRVSNPTRTALEENLAALEGGTSAHVFGSGMAAIAALCALMRSGDHVVCSSYIYGGTTRLFDQVLTNYGLEFTYVDTTGPENVERAIRPSTKLVHIETLSNPMMTVTDVRAVAEICHRHGVELSVDNTFLSPYLHRPIEFGADIVMHSTTKFLNGHSDGLGGVLVGTRAEHRERFSFVQKCTGGILSPFECWLVLRGVKTLAVRMRQHDANGRAVAAWLQQHPKVRRVYYPGLPDHPQHALARRQMDGFGSMMTFDVGTQEAANKMLRRLQVCVLGESLGGVETLLSHPATMSHASLHEEERRKLGITDGMVRVSVGIEDVEDILADLDQAMQAI